jgi:hypothetical protein
VGKTVKNTYGGKNPKAENETEGGLTTMAKGQDSGTTTLLRLKDCKVGQVWEEDEIYLGIDEHSFRHQEMVHTKVYL